MPVSSQLLAFFDALTSEADLTRLITEKTEEGLYLEFKQKADRSKPEFDDKDRWQFSRALGGFANSDGGIMIWGIETNKQEQAAKLKPITDVIAFQASLKKSLLNTTQPVVDEVRIEVIVSNASPMAGYVKCLIPSSERTPHRSMQADREYYKRTAEGFYRLEHFDLEDMFGRRPVPRLTIEHEVRKGSSTSGYGGRTQNVAIELRLKNVGRGSARAPYIEIEVAHPYSLKCRGVSSEAPESLLQLFEERAGCGRFIGRSDFLIHPDTAVTFAVVTRQFREVEPNVGDLAIRLRYAAENARLNESTVAFPVLELLRAVGWAA